MTVKVLVVDDSLTMRNLISAALRSDPEIQAVGAAAAAGARGGPGGRTGGVLQGIALGWADWIGRQPVWTVLLFPIGAWEVVRVMRWAERTLRRGEPVRWGGREYVIKASDAC